tara:strand:+ start:3129 stop:4088 length:960 start_codon:yes stop_codon:yes gene_type:complete
LNLKMINKNSKIYLAGHTGLVGSSVLRVLKKKGFKKIIIKKRKELDLINQNKVFKFLKKTKPDAVIICAAKVGGIKANNKFKSEFIYENLSIQNNIIKSAHIIGVNNLIFLGSSCIYPKFSKQPIKEEYLLTSELEPTNQYYALAKIAGVKLCESFNVQYKRNYISLMPSNLFGPNDNYNLENSHFLPAVIKKIYLAKQNQKSLIFWGTGKAKRELTYVDDVAEACVFFLKKKTKHTLINIGSGQEKTIKEYINLICKKLGYKEKIKFNDDKFMDGTPRKILDCSIAKKYGWKSKWSLKKSIDLTIKDFELNKRKYLQM